MILYFAAAGGIAGMEDKPKLESFWYKNDAIAAMRTDAPFFLDSGAFTAFTKGVSIQPDDYAEFIHIHKEKITVASSLDAIGDAEKTYALYLVMKESGCDVMPVFHCREDESWLKKYLDEGCGYIALGGMVPEAKPWLLKWLDNIWGDYLMNPDGSARVKVHGFGMTILDFMLRYPWHSVDSSSWTYGARFSYGLIKYPNGRYIWTYFGEAHASRKNWGGKNYHTFNEYEKQAVQNFVTSKGFKVSGFIDTQILNLFNAKVFEGWLNYKPEPFKKESEGLF